jgi:hypothetical protein
MVTMQGFAVNDGIVITASAPEQVAVGERFRIVFSINGRPTSFEAPSFDGFRLVSGPSQSTSSSTQIINNQVTTSISVSYTYILEGLQEGVFNIPPAKATADGRTITGELVSIRVSGQAPPGGQASPPSPGQQVPSQPQQLPGDDDLFVRAVVSNANPYQGEQVVVTYKIYTRVPISRYSIDRLPNFQGFWSENLTDSSAPEVTTEVIDGITYNVAEIRRVALFPQRHGELIVEPLEVECMVRLRSAQRRGSLLEDFFSGTPFDSFQQVPLTIRSNRIRLNVRPLPVQNRPPAFGGLVGSFDISGGLAPSQLNVNDAASLSLTISGNGNMHMMEKPVIPFSPDLEVFDPNIADNLRRDRNGVSGSRTFEYLIIPRAAGQLEIPAIELAWFDPRTGSYVSRKTGPFTLSVSAGPGGQAGVAAGGQEGIRQIGTDIRFIYTHRFPLVPLGNVFFRSQAFYLWLILPFLVFIAFLVYWRRQIKLRGNAALLRTRKAEGLARKRLRKASLLMKKNARTAFYEEVSRALWGYLSDRLNIPVSKLNMETVRKELEFREVSEELARGTMGAIERCEFARFAPGKTDEELDETYRLAHVTIVNLEKAFRKKKIRENRGKLT